MFLGRTENFHYTRQLLLFVLAREDRVTSKKFSKDTAERPHVNWHPVCHPENDLWRTVEARLDIGIDLLVFHAAGSEVDDLDLRASGMGE